jgi:predicted Zn-dependent protease with MMP-like domain
VGRYQIYLDKAYDAIDRRAFNEAIRWCKKAAAEDPSAPEAHNARGEALDAAGMWEEALEAFDRALERDPEFVDALLNKAEILGDRQETAEQALPLCDEAERITREGEDESLLAEVHYLRGNALQTLFRFEEALPEYERALSLSPDQPDYLLEKGSTLYNLLEYERAEECLAAALELDPESADAHYVMGLLLEKTDRDAQAQEELAAATRIDPTRYPPVLRVPRERFAARVEEALESLPEEFARHLANVAVLIEDVPEREHLRDLGLDPQLLAVFEGAPQSEPSGNRLPARITLYQRNLEKICLDEEELREQISITVMHEVGHYFGMSEDDLRELGLE